MSIRKKTKIISFLILGLLIIALTWAYFAFGYMFFVSPETVEMNHSQKIHSIAGSNSGEEGFKDGTGEGARMFKPIRLATLNENTVVFADINNHAIRTVTQEGEVFTIAGGPGLQGYQDGPATEARMDNPHGVTVRVDGVIAVAEVKNNTIRLLTPEDNDGRITYKVSTLAGVPGESGMHDGINEEALFSSPHAVAWGPDGELYVADIGNARIRMIHQGETSTVAGRDETGQDDGDINTGTLKYPMDIATDDHGNVWIVDAGTMLVRKWNREEGLSTPFPGIELAMPHGIAILEDRYVVVAEMYGHRVVMIDVESGVMSIVCGTTEKGIGEGKLSKPAAVLVSQEKIWVADLGNHRIVNVGIPPI
jgi:hypothetical protein